MAVQFVIGRSGSGKTHRCMSAIIESMRNQPLGGNIFWILPRQATFSAERQLTCNSNIPGFFRARVFSFEQLGNEIIRSQGGESIPMITTLGRRMIIGHLLRTHAAELKYFGPVALQPGLADKLDATFSDFESAGKTSVELHGFEKVLRTWNTPDQQTLADKIHDLTLIYQAYTDFLGQERLDQHHRLLHVLKQVEQSPIFKNAEVYVDGFYEFSEYERQILARLGQRCKKVEINLTIDPGSAILFSPDQLPGDLSLFHPVESAYRRLRILFREQAVAVDEPIVLLKEMHRFTSPAISAIERHAFGSAVTYVQRSADGIKMQEVASISDEVDAAARQIRDYLKKGLRLRDICVLVRQLSDYEELIKSKFPEYGIRFFLDRRRSTRHHPLLQFVRTMLTIAQGKWPHAQMMSLLKTGLVGIDDEQLDALENYVLAHRIQGQQWASVEPWQFEDTGLLVSDAAAHAGMGRADVQAGAEVDAPSESTAKSPQSDSNLQIDMLRRKIANPISKFIAEINGSQTVRSFCIELMELIEAFPVRATLTRWRAVAESANDIELMHEHTQVWVQFVDLLEQVVDLLGDETVSLSAFENILEAGLLQVDLGLTPATVDEVLVGQVDRTRTGPVKAVLVLGLNEGQFPAAPAEATVLSESDRRLLQRGAIELSSMPERRLLNEEFLGYRAMTAASDQIYLSRSINSAKGDAIGASRFWRRLERMFPTARIASAPTATATPSAIEKISTARQLTISLMDWVKELGPQTVAKNSGAHQAYVQLYSWMQKDNQFCASPVFRTAWASLQYQNIARLHPDTVSRLFPSPLSTTVSELESLATCPFKHFIDYGLQLQRRDDRQQVSGLDLGSIYHSVMHRMVQNLVRSQQCWNDLTDQQKINMMMLAVEHIGHKLRGEIMLSTARNRYLLQRIEKTLRQIIDTQTTTEARGKFRPGYANLKFGKGETLGELVIPTISGREIRLHGMVDRVDIDESTQGFTVIDYRLGQRKLELDEIYYGLTIQLMTLLLVVEENSEKLYGNRLLPAAALYMRMRRPLADVDHPGEAPLMTEAEYHLKPKPRGIIDQEFLQAIDSRLASGKTSEVVNVTLNKDGETKKAASSDAANHEQILALLHHVKSMLSNTADRIFDGEISIAPYSMGNKTPCAQCDLRSICRFDSRGYRFLEKLRREDVLNEVVDNLQMKQSTKDE